MLKNTFALTVAAWLLLAAGTAGAIPADVDASWVPSEPKRHPHPAAAAVSAMWMRLGFHLNPKGIHIRRAAVAARARAVVATTDLTGVKELWPAGASAVAAVGDDGRVIVLHDDGRRGWPPAPDGCTFKGSGGERLLWGCGQSGLVDAPTTDHLATTDLDGGGLVPIDVTTFSDPAYEPVLVAAGTRWLLLDVTPYGLGYSTYVAWRTGRQVSGRDDADRRKAPDLDAEQLFRPLCAPFLRAPAPDSTPYATDPYQSIEYASPWVVLRWSGAYAIQRCGRWRPALVFPAKAFPIIDGRRVAWSVGVFGGRMAFGVRRLTGRAATIVRYAPPAAYDQEGGAQMILTRGRLFLAVPGRGSERFHQAVASAPLPEAVR